jgi:hypothetical protein
MFNVNNVFLCYENFKLFFYLLRNKLRNEIIWELLTKFHRLKLRTADVLHKRIYD